MRKYIVGSIVTLLIIVLAVGAYLLGSKKTFTRKKEELDEKQQQVEESDFLPQNQEIQHVDVEEQVKAAIISMNTSALEGYMADIVEVRLEASGCCGPISKTEAISQLSYLDSATGWDFNSNNPIIIDLANTVPDYYGAGWLVGVASNEYIVSFKINSQNKIEAYNLGASYKLLLP